MYRVLVIPGLSEDLDLSSEVFRLSNIGNQFDSISVTVLLADSELEIVDQLSADNTTYDAVHWLGHAEVDGFMLGSGMKLSKERIHAICVDAGARMAFLNACVSGSIGQYLVNNRLAVALCYAVPILDSDAVINAVRFYSALARSNDPFEDGLRDAYKAADPGGGTLLWLTNGEYTAQIISPIKAMLAELSDKLLGVDTKHDTAFDKFSQSLSNLEGKLSTSVKSLSKSASATRYAMMGVVAAVALLMAVAGWGLASSQTIPPTGETLPPLPTKNGTIPPAASPAHPTKKPSPVPPTKKPTPTSHPTSSPSSTPRGSPTPLPTNSPTDTSSPTETLAPVPPSHTPKISTPTNTAQAPTAPTITLTPIPPTPTLTDFDIAVKQAVQATIAAWAGCNCE